MEELKKLIQIIEEEGKGSASALLDLNDKSSLEVKLYYVVKEADALNEAEVLQQIYGTSDKGSAFRMLKSRVKKKLYNQLHFLDVDNIKRYNHLRTAEIKCTSILNEALILNHIDAIRLREKLTVHALKIAKEAALTKHIIKALEIQRSLYSFDLFDRKKFFQISDELVVYNDLLYQEAKADDLYFKLMVETRVGVKNRQAQAPFINDCVVQLHKLWKQTRSSNIFSRYYAGKVVALESNGNTAELIKHLKDSEVAYLNGEINKYHFQHERNQFSLTYAYLKSRQFEEGLQAAEQLKQQLNPSKQNWFAHMENYFMLATHSRNPAKAAEILSDVFSNQYFSNNTQFAKERWFLFGEYFAFAYGQRVQKAVKKPKLEFIIQDKNGYNVWFIILEFLKHLESKDTELIVPNTERLRKYVAKHFGPKSDPRTRRFFKLLLIAGQECQDAQLCRQKGAQILKKLEQTSVEGDAYAETEIIPYEHMWELILQKMERRR